MNDEQKAAIRAAIDALDHFMHEDYWRHDFVKGQAATDGLEKLLKEAGE